jgi:outer membrane protein
MRMTSVTAAVALLGLAAPLAHADETSDLNNQVRIGMYYIHYASSADDISGPYTPAGLNLRIDDLETLYLAYVRRLSTHFELELALGYPPLTKTVGRGPEMLGSVPYNGQVITTARWLAPSLLLNYKFFDDTYALRPYVGIGINYTDFYSRQSTAAGNAVTGGPTSISLPSSVGPLGDVGLSYRITDRFRAYASYSISYVHSRLSADTAGLIHTTNIDFQPRALVVSVGYSF